MLKLEGLTARGLNAIDLTLADGECLVVRGASGAGKTVLLRAIADLDENGGDAETCHVRRSQVSAPRWRRDVAYVPAEPGWWADTVGAHLTPGRHCTALLHDLGLTEDCLTWQIARLSTGERQRLALIRALEAEPSVLLLDEPTSALDAAATDAVERVIRRRLDGGVTAVIVSHDAGQAHRLATRVGDVADGQLTVTAAGSQP
jgi:putative ABC transport system ATP-binding protein